MSQIPNSKGKTYDLEERALLFTKRTARYVNKLPKTIPNVESGKQPMRASGSVGANYIEANECLGKKDFAMKIKTSKKEAKEARYWLAITEPAPEEEKEKEALSQEATELMKIFGSILEKTKWAV
ncbi:MAG: four helix bundle protein [Candidatus Liptonbacteria bacterium]|nr:four helix bundle protein [Candidatus Liptonbacteria bacterium]